MNVKPTKIDYNGDIVPPGSENDGCFPVMIIFLIEIIALLLALFLEYEN